MARSSRLNISNEREANPVFFSGVVSKLLCASGEHGRCGEATNHARSSLPHQAKLTSRACNGTVPSPRQERPGKRMGFRGRAQARVQVVP